EGKIAVTMDSSKAVHANFELIKVEASASIPDDADLPAASPVESIFNDTPIAAAVPMPQTAGIPMELVFLGGSSLLGLGLKLKKRR
ncbi:MAG: hypothetical protein PF505_06205, partial [Vallitaleaceae bacterium]|nr:hypothetical protein [Vallitaleaceae bacterium]